MTVEEIITVAGDGITLSNLVWRRFRKRATGVAEAVLAANPGLAGAGPFIPIGMKVRFPAIDDVPATSAVTTLWD
jgi:phage tail protein X